MAYTRLTWVESETPLSAQNMNNIEDGIEELKAQKADKVSGKGLSTNDYTTAEKTKLAGIEAGAEVNQDAFSNIKVGSTIVAADDKTDTLELVAGSNVTLTPDASNDKVTIAATDTTYSSKAAASGGTAVSLVTTGEKYTWNSKAGAAVNSLTSTSTTAALSAAQGKALNDNKAAKSDAIKNITRSGTTFTATKADGTTFTFTQQDNNTTYSNATTSAAGLMSAADKTKLNGIAAGAQVNPGVATTSAAGLMSAADKTKLNKYTSSPSDLFDTSVITLNLTIGGSNYATGTYSITKSGYWPLGIIGYELIGGEYPVLEKIFMNGSYSGSGTVGYSVCSDKPGSMQLKFEVLWCKL